MKRRSDGTLDLSGVDPRVAQEVERAQVRRSERTMTKAQKSRAARNTVSYDLPADLDRTLDDLAAHLSVPVSQVARWVLLVGLQHTDLPSMVKARIPSRSMRYEFVLFPPEASPKGKR